MGKGQSAIEFLTTYGMSFIVLLAVIGGLAYFDILDVSSFVPTSCSLDQGISCPVYTVYVDATRAAVLFDILNSGDDRIVVTRMSMKDGSADDYCFSNDVTDVGSVATLTPAERTITVGNSAQMRFEFDDGAAGCVMANSIFNQFDKKRFDVRLYYLKRGATQESSVSGKIIIKPEVYP